VGAGDGELRRREAELRRAQMEEERRAKREEKAGERDARRQARALTREAQSSTAEEKRALEKEPELQGEPEGRLSGGSVGEDTLRVLRITEKRRRRRERRRAARKAKAEARRAQGGVSATTSASVSASVALRDTKSEVNVTESKRPRPEEVRAQQMRDEKLKRQVEYMEDRTPALGLTPPRSPSRVTLHPGWCARALE
jgi:hypothetical protein